MSRIVKILKYLSGDRNRSSTGWIAVFFIRFVIASLLLYLLFMKFGIHYSRLICRLAGPVLAIFNRRVIMSKAVLITEDIALNPVVFLSLVIATVNIPVIRKMRGAVIGVLILTAANSLTVAMAFMSYYRGSEALWTGTEFFNITINFFLPVFLLFVLLPVRSVLAGTGASRDK